MRIYIPDASLPGRLEVKEATSIICTGVLWAFVLAWVAFIVREAGISVLPVIGAPLLATWILGEKRGHAKGVRDLKEAMGRSEER